jgi:hypothetical protein
LFHDLRQQGCNFATKNANMTELTNEQRDNFLLDVRDAIKRNQVVMIILYNDENDEYAVFSNTYGQDFDEVLSGFLKLPILGRVSPQDAFEQWEDYFDDVALAEIYGFELEDGMAQMAILEYYIIKQQ